MALTGTLAPIDAGDGKQALEIAFNVRLPSSLQILSFVVCHGPGRVFGGMYLRKQK